MKYTTLANIIIEAYNSHDLHGTNIWLGTNNFVNVYKSYPHFDSQFKDRYYRIFNTRIKYKISQSCTRIKNITDIQIMFHQKVIF